MKVYIEDLTINLILPYVVFNDMATHNSKIYRLSYFDLLHKNSQFLTLRSILKDLSSNSCKLVISTKLDHQIFSMHISLRLIFQEDLENSISATKHFPLIYVKKKNALGFVYIVHLSCTKPYIQLQRRISEYAICLILD